MSFPFADGAGPLPDSRWELLFACIVLVAAVVGVMLYVQANPGAPWQLEAAYSSALTLADSAPVTPNTTLYLPEEDAAYLNRIYRELDGYTETGYCVYLIGDEMRVTKAATLEASESMVRFTTANCRTVTGTIHTHPPHSRPVLSGPDNAVHDEFNDKNSLLASGYQFSCVQAGLVPTDPGTQTRAMRCYLPPASGDIDDAFPEIPVEIR